MMKNIIHLEDNNLFRYVRVISLLIVMICRLQITEK